MNAKSKQFLNDLKELLEKHEMRIDSYDDHDNEDCYMGTNYSFVGPDIYLDMCDLKEGLE